MDNQNINEKLVSLEGWNYNAEKGMLYKEFVFKGYLKTIGFVNAIAWIANRENHHPDLEVSFNKCLVKLTTHDDGNQLSDKDFNLAKLIQEL